MFEQLFVSNRQNETRFWTLLVSASGELALITLAVLAPLLFTEAIAEGWWAGHMIQPLPPPGRPAPPAPEAVVRRSTGQAARPFTPSGKLLEPASYPPKPALLLEPEEPLPTGYFGQDSPGVPGGLSVPGGAGGAWMGDVVRSFSEAASPPKVEMPKATDEIPRVRVGGLVAPPAPVNTPQPVYPELARRARIEGVVVLEALIARDGTIHGIRVLQGHPLLIEAAVQTVRQWRYRPPTLNGEPVEMVMIVDIRFKFGR